MEVEVVLKVVVELPQMVLVVVEVVRGVRVLLEVPQR
jgi:hypothetical protein